MDHYNWNSDLSAPVPAAERQPVRAAPTPVARTRPSRHRRTDVGAPVSALQRGRRDGYAPAPPKPVSQWGTRGTDGTVVLPEGRLPKGVVLTPAGKKLAASLLEPVLIVVTLGVGWVLWAMMVAWKGQTPARHLLGMRVVSARNGVALGLGGMVFVRGIYGLLVQVAAVLLSLGGLAFMPLWDGRNQTVCDKVTDSLVVNDRDQLVVML